MANYDLGVYRPRPMGNFDGTVNYRYLDIVSYEGGSYININLDTIDGVSCIGILPTGQPMSGLYWQELAVKGEKGDMADSYQPFLTIENGTWDYSLGDKVFIPTSDSLVSMNISNVYDGCCGIIVTKNNLSLPSNSMFSLDYYYTTVIDPNDYYFYTFCYTKVGSANKFIWHRTVVNNGR